jgi:hypothetical protein
MKMDFKSMYDFILSLDENVRFIGFIDEIGKLVYGGMRPGKLSLENETDSIKIYMENALIDKIHTDFDEKLGKVIYSITVREKIEILTFPIEKYIIRISLERNTDYSKILYSILDYLKKINSNPDPSK